MAVSPEVEQEYGEMLTAVVFGSLPSLCSAGLSLTSWDVDYHVALVVSTPCLQLAALFRRAPERS